MIRRCALFLLGLVVLQSIWLWALPPFQGMDEFDHAYRADSVAAGHWQPGRETTSSGRGALIRVSPTIVEAAAPSCLKLDYTGIANCRPSGRPDRVGNRLVASAAATYNPAWYVVTGVAARPFAGTSALYAMRIANLVLCDLILLVAAWIHLKRWPSHRTSLLGVALAVSPAVMMATVTAAPNGAALCAGILLWTSLLALPSDDEGNRGGRGQWVGIGIGATALMWCHSTGVLWVALVLATGWPLWRVRMRQARSQDRVALRLTAAWILASATIAVGWIVWAGTNNPTAEHDAPDFGAMPLEKIAISPLLWLFQSIGTGRMRNQMAPMTTYAIAVAGLCALLIVALKRARSRERWTLALVIAASIAVPLALSILAYPHVGPAWQGRYSLPLSVGVVVVAAHVVTRTGLITDSTAVLVVTAMCAAQIANAVGLRRYEEASGFAAPSSLTWQCLIGLVAGLLTVVLWWSAMRVGEDKDPTPSRISA